MYQPLLTCTILIRARANYRVVHLVILICIRFHRSVSDKYNFQDGLWTNTFTNLDKYELELVPLEDNCWSQFRFAVKDHSLKYNFQYGQIH